nr:MAG TPA: zinc-ribbon containing domain protein [Caudoviricetes sp.]
MDGDLISRKALLEKTETIYAEVDNVIMAASVVTRTDIVMAQAVDAVPRAEYEGLLKRFRHLLESDFIGSFAEVETFTGQYKRDIAEADKVEPVRHGRWRHLGGDEWGCTMCGEVIHTEGSWERPSDKYCRECGTRMDEEVRKQWMKQK